MGELGALFNPGMRHELEERRARAARREEEGNGRDGDLRIDLESGVAVINAPGDEQSDGQSDGETDSAAGPHNAATITDGEAGDGSARVDGATGPDRDRDRDAATGSATSDADVPDDPAAEADPAAEPAAAPLRPRGKRAMSAGRR